MRRILTILGVTAATVIVGAGASNAAAPDGTYTIKDNANSHGSSIGVQSSAITQNGQFVSGNGDNLVITDQTTYPGSRADLVQAALGH
jgi:hypothetical protein